MKCHRAFPQYTSAFSSLFTTVLDSRKSLETIDVDNNGDQDKIEDEAITPLLGKISLRLESKTSKAALQITWCIDLDWIGDVESRVSATASLPARWVERDRQRDSLGKIPKAFELLVRKVGVYEAIKVLVGIVLDRG